MDNNRWDVSWKTLKEPLILLAVFLGIGIWRGLAAHILYLYNFGYIGLALAIGGFLSSAAPHKHKQWGRRIFQILVASYLLVYIGIVYRENMQIEGFFFYLLAGVFAGTTLHYFVAKVVGTFILNRGWCGWACWTAMVLDLLPWRVPKEGRLRRLGIVRYVHFALSLGLVLFVWFVMGKRELFARKSVTELYWLAAGNALYYIVGISFAFILKDNRAFCKYVCPIPVLQKIGARPALWRIVIDPEKCVDCGLCEKNCPMNIKLLDFKRAGHRVLSTECILCQNCVHVCLKSAVGSSLKGFDMAWEEHLRYRDEGAVVG